MAQETSHRVFFLIDTSEAQVGSTLSLKDIIGTGHRLDVICRLLVAAFWWGSRLLRQVSVIIAFKLNAPLEVDGSELEESRVPRTELGFARLLKEIYVDGVQVPGFHNRKQTIGELIPQFQSQGSKIFWLEEGGKPLETVEDPLNNNEVFILGDHRGMSEEFNKEFSGKISPVSIGPKSYLGSTCIQLILGRKFF